MHPITRGPFSWALQTMHATIMSMATHPTVLGPHMPSVSYCGQPWPHVVTRAKVMSRYDQEYVPKASCMRLHIPFTTKHQLVLQSWPPMATHAKSVARCVAVSCMKPFASTWRWSTKERGRGRTHTTVGSSCVSQVSHVHELRADHTSTTPVRSLAPTLTPIKPNSFLSRSPTITL
jgi:hypothetical protein